MSTNNPYADAKGLGTYAGGGGGLLAGSGGITATSVTGTVNLSGYGPSYYVAAQPYNTYTHPGTTYTYPASGGGGFNISPKICVREDCHRDTCACRQSNATEKKEPPMRKVSVIIVDDDKELPIEQRIVYESPSYFWTENDNETILFNLGTILTGAVKTQNDVRKSKELKPKAWTQFRKIVQVQVSL